MRSEEQLEAWRRMEPAERWKTTGQLMEFAWRELQELPFEERERRLEIARRHHRLSNEAIVAALRAWAIIPREPRRDEARRSKTTSVGRSRPPPDAAPAAEPRRPTKAAMRSASCLARRVVGTGAQMRFDSRHGLARAGADNEAARDYCSRSEGLPVTTRHPVPGESGRA
ncbi:MAG: hypothetical protein MUE73_15100 [Planctomycetes bacterium]|nr:hypothetical protein [Planctomycetota bacterium]